MSSLNKNRPILKITPIRWPILVLLMIILMISNIVWPQNLEARIESSEIKSGNSYKIKHLLFDEDGGIISSKIETQEAKNDGFLIANQKLPANKYKGATYSSFCVIEDKSDFINNNDSCGSQDDSALVFNGCQLGTINIVKIPGTLARFSKDKKTFSQSSCNDIASRLLKSINGIDLANYIKLSGFEHNDTKTNQKLSLNNGILRLGDGNFVDLSEFKGDSGRDGLDGEPGSSGQNGVDGLNGQQGSIGLTGPQGVVGGQGLDGQQGAQGSPGVLNVVTGDGLDSTLASQVLTLDLTIDPNGGLTKSSTGLGLTATCSNGQLLKWNGTSWACATDIDTDTDTQDLSLTSNTLSLVNGGSVDLTPYLDNTDSQALSWNGGTRTLSLANGGSVVIPDADTTYTAGTGITLSGTTFALTNTGVAPGTYNLVTVDAQGRITSANNIAYLTSEQDGVIGNEIADVTSGSGLIRTGTGTTGDPYQVSLITTCSANQLLKYSGTSWACATDIDTDTDAQTVSWNSTSNILTISGGNTADLSSLLDNTDSQTVSTTGAGNSSTLTVSGGNTIALADNDTLRDLSCISTQVAKWNGTSWACATDIDTDTDAQDL
jgi:hypothetical protein